MASMGEQSENLTVLWVNDDSDRVSGVARTPKETIPHLAGTAANQVIYVCPKPAPSIAAREVVATVSFRDILTDSGYKAGYYPVGKFEDLIRKHRASALIANSPAILGSNAIDAAHKTGLPSVAIAGTDAQGFAVDIIQDKLPERLAKYFTPRILKAIDERERHIHQTATFNLYPSQATKQHLLDLGVAEDRMGPWGRGVNSIFSNELRNTPEAQRFRTEAGLKQDDIAIVSASRLAPEKSLTDLQALLKLEDTPDFPCFKFLFANGGPMLERLQGMFGDKAIFFGELNDQALANFYAAGDIYVHTCRTDTYGQVIPEAQRSGLAVVAPNQGGPRGLIEQGITGFKFDTLQEMVEIVRGLGVNPELRQTIGTQAYNSVKDRTWEMKAEQLVNYVHRAIDLNRTRLRAEG